MKAGKSGPRAKDGSPDFIAGGGEMGARMRSHDWAATALGSPGAWPQALRSALGICLNTRFPIAIYWGPDLALLYNDAWSPIPGAKHPWALGRPAREVWPEIWDMIGPLFDRVLTTGEGTYSEDQLLPMRRRGFTEECYFNFTFSPIRDEDGRVAGIFNAVIETTYRVVDERRTRLLRELAEHTSAARSAEEVCTLAVRAMAAAAVDLPFCLLYLLEEGGRRARLVARTGLAADGFLPAEPDVEASPWPFAASIGSGRAELVGQVASRLGAAPAGPWPEPVEHALVAPIAAAVRPGELPAGFLVAGVSPRLAPDEGYRAFVERAAAHLAGAIASARAYEEERRRAEALAELDSAKTAFFANISHEFRTPLTLMLGPLEESLAEAARLPPEERERVEVAHRNALRLLRLVNSLLDFSRVEAGRARARYVLTDLAALTAELASSFRSLCEHAGLALEVNCPPLPNPVFVDHEMWEKVVLNLLSNAFKFTFEGGIAVSLRPSTDGNVAEFVVRDTGTGIPPEELPRLFERFHRIEGARGRSFEGSGIGLALVRELVRLHGGEIRVESEPGRGSAFIVTVPFGAAHLPSEHLEGDRTPDPAAGLRAQAYVEEARRWLQEGDGRTGEGGPDPLLPASSDGRLPPLAHGSGGGGGRVLLADDNADMRDYVHRLLAGRGYEVEPVADGEAALQAARRQRPDLVLSDVMMPRLDGFGLLRALRTDPALTEVPVILLSARAGEEARVEGLDAGADDYLTKPFSAQELLARVGANLSLARVRREAAEAVRARSAELEAVLATVPAGVWFTRDANARHAWCNPRAAALLRLPQGTNASLSAPAAERPSYRVFRNGAEALPETLPLQRAARGEEVQGDELEIRFEDGAPPVILFCRAAPLRNKSGEPTGAVCAAIDITERRRTEEALRESTRRLDAVLDNATVAIFLMDDRQNCIYMNNAAERLTGYTLPETLGRPLHDVIHHTRPNGSHFPIEECPIDRAFPRNMREQGEEVFVHKDGSFYPVAYTASPIHDEAAKAIGTVIEVRDIRREKEAEAALREETHTLEVLNRTGAALAAELGLGRVVQMVTDAATELSGAAFGAFFYNMVDERGESYALYTLSGAPREAFERFPMPRNTAVFGPTFRGEGIVRSDDITKDPRYGKNAPRHGMPEGHLPVHSYLAVPVVSRSGEVLGGLFFGHPQPGVFTERSERVVAGIAAQAAVAIDNARLYQAAQREIAARRAAEEQLRRLNEMLEERVAERTQERDRLWKLSRDPFLIADAEGRWLSISPTWTELLGWSEEELLGRTSEWMEHPEDQERTRAEIARLAAGGESLRYENRFRTSDGTWRWFSWTAVHAGGLLYCVARDVTAEKQGEAALRHAEEQLRQAQKMEAVGQLTGGVAHDFNNLLTVITGNLDALLRHLPEMEGMGRLRRSAENALKGAQRAASLTHRLLAFSRRQPLAPKPLDVNKLVAGMSELLRRTLGETIAIETVQGGGLWRVEADPNQLESALLNLAVNARDAMPEGGKLTIETANAYLDQAYTGAHSEVAPGQYVVIAVTDTGIGMSKDVLDRVFEPFFTTKQVGQGTGLGLSQVYGFVKQSGGHVKIYSEPGQGATVKLYLPRLYGDVLAEEEAGTATPVPEGGREETILVVEDDADVRAYSTETLRELGYRVVEAPDGPTALRLIERLPRLDLLFTDVVLPEGMTGRQLADAARALRPRLKVLFTTGYARNAIVHHGRLDPGVDLLPKPFTYSELAARVRDALDAPG